MQRPFRPVFKITQAIMVSKRRPLVIDHLLRSATIVKKVLRPWKDSYRPEISPDEFIQIHVESMENGTGLVFSSVYFLRK